MLQITPAVIFTECKCMLLKPTKVFIPIRYRYFKNFALT